MTQKFLTTYILLLLCQMAICNYFNLSPIVTVSLLPAMVMCIPLSVNTIVAMVMAFISGLAVDFAADGVIGLNAMALVPVALCRKSIMRLFLGTDTIEREETFSFKTKGFGRISGVIIFALTIFLVLYIAADGAGTRTSLFNLFRFLCSAAVSYFFSLAVIALLSPETDHR